MAIRIKPVQPIHDNLLYEDQTEPISEDSCVFKRLLWRNPPALKARGEIILKYFGLLITIRPPKDRSSLPLMLWKQRVLAQERAETVR